MKPSFTEKVNKVFSSKIWYYVENIIVVGLLFYCIKSLTDYDNVYYQTWKNEAAAKAILAFTAIVFIIRKVKLLNWQSLVATLLFGAVVFERLHFWADAEDILNAVKPQLVAEWLSLMIIIDMILYKNINNLFKGVNYLAILYILMTFGMIWRRHDRMDPIVLVFPMLLFALVKMEKDRIEWLYNRFIDSWFISFIYVIARSFIENPYKGFRYYGYFLNIGYFGVYMVCCLVVAISALVYTKNTSGRKNIKYIIAIIWIISLSYMLWIINTRTILVGLVFCLIFHFLFIRKKVDRKIIIKRALILGAIILISSILFVFLAKLSVNISNEWINKYYKGTFSPVVYLVMNMRGIGRIINDNTIGLWNKIYQIVDTLSSSRLSIAKEYSQSFSYDGNGSIGVLIEEDDYWAYGAHNTYIQFCIEYGYLTIVEILSIFILALANSIKLYIRNNNRNYTVLFILWFAAMFGVWFGESCTLFYPITFWGFVFVSRLLPITE